jgi:DNA-binding MarR family transcriptional regulator
MADKRKTATNQLPQFVQYLAAIMGKLSSPSPDEMLDILNQIEEINPKQGPHFVTDLSAFYNLSNILYHSGKLTMGELSHTLAVPMSTATRAVERWVNSGFAQRLSDPDDRRIVRIDLTENGKRLHEIIENSISGSIQRAMSCLTSEEQSMIVTLTRKVAEGLNQDKTQ